MQPKPTWDKQIIISNYNLKQICLSPFALHSTEQESKMGKQNTSKYAKTPKRSLHPRSNVTGISLQASCHLLSPFCSTDIIVHSGSSHRHLSSYKASENKKFLMQSAPLPHPKHQFLFVYLIVLTPHLIHMMPQSIES